MTSTLTPTAILVEPAPGRCLRVGCSRARAAHEPHGLCAVHQRQLHAGTIGASHNTRRREVPIARAQDLLQHLEQVVFPDAHRRPSVRRMAAATGLSKDLVHHVRRGTWAHVRSVQWQAMQDATANAEYEQRCAQRRERDRLRRRRQREAQRRQSPSTTKHAA